jgi:hypothetical protein
MRAHDDRAREEDKPLYKRAIYIEPEDTVLRGQFDVATINGGLQSYISTYLEATPQVGSPDTLLALNNWSMPIGMIFKEMVCHFQR